MKKILALILATTMLLCICGCSSENDTSSDSVEVEYEEIVIDEFPKAKKYSKQDLENFLKEVGE